MSASAITRRTWLGGTAAALGGAGFALASGDFRHAIGLQLYTVRSIIRGHEDETLRRVAEAGYTEVELADGTIDTLAPILAKYKLKAVSTHLDELSISDNSPAEYKGPPLDQLIARAKRHGLEYVVFPYLPPPQRDGLDGYKRLAEKLNRAGELVRAAGLTFCYHNHAFEFGGEKGQRPIDVYQANLDQKLVKFEIDVFWVSVTGNDPVAILKEFSGRVPLIHLKDKAAGTEVRYNEGVPKESFKEVGSGTLDFSAILRTAQATGVKHYFVEQDWTPGDPIESIRKSYNFLRSAKV